MRLKSWLANKRKRLLLARGPIVVNFHNDVLRWIGFVEAFEYGGKAVRIRKIKTIIDDMSMRKTEVVYWKSELLKEATRSCFFLSTRTEGESDAVADE